MLVFPERATGRKIGMTVAKLFALTTNEKTRMVTAKLFVLYTNIIKKLIN